MDNTAFGIVLGFELFGNFISFSSENQMNKVILLRIHLASWNDEFATSALYMRFLSDVTLGLSDSFFRRLDCNSFVWFQLNFVKVEIQRFMWIAMWMHFSIESL